MHIKPSDVLKRTVMCPSGQVDRFTRLGRGQDVWRGGGWELLGSDEVDRQASPVIIAVKSQ